MVVSHRNRFIKVFIASLIFLAIAVILLVWGINAAYKISESNSENSINLLRVTYTLIAIFILVGEVLYIYSHYLLAKARGYSGWLVLLGLLNGFIGLAIIFLLPDKRKENILPSNPPTV